MLSIWTSLKFCHLVNNKSLYPKDQAFGLAFPSCNKDFQIFSSFPAMSPPIRYRLHIWSRINPLPQNKTLESSKLKVFAQDIKNIAEKMLYGTFQILSSDNG